MKLLLIYDSEADRVALRTLLGTFTPAVEQALPASHEPASPEGFDAVLLGLTAPEARVARTVERLSSGIEGVGPAVIVVTSHGNEELAAACMRNGALDYLTRDTLSTDRLQRALIRAVETVALRRRVRDQQARLAREAGDRTRLLVELREREQDLRVALRAAGMVTWQWDAVANALTVDPELDRLCGHPPGTLAASIGGDFAHIHTDDRAAVKDALRRALLSPEEFAFEFRVLRPDGSSSWLSARGRALVNGAATTQVAGVVYDVTSARSADLAMRDARAATVEANDAKTRFLASMSHEIRTPLGTLLGFSELLGSDASLSPEERAAAAAVVRKTGEQLTRLIGDVLDLSRIEAGRLEAEREEVALLPFLEDMRHGLETAAREKGLAATFEIEAMATLPRTIITSANQLRQAWRHVLSNAVKFTERGRIDVRVALSPSGRLTVLVKDTGVGIPADKRELIFAPFVQADGSTTRRFGGAGLGLTLARDLARALSGDVALLETTPTNGSTFCVTAHVGIVAKSAATDSMARAAPAPRSSPMVLAQKHILVVDDARDNRILLERMLSLAGAFVDLAPSGPEALRMAAERVYDAVLMDIQMPEMDGIRTTESLRQDGYTKPVIALTAHAMPADRERCLSSGFDAFVVKPVRRDFLLATLRAALGRAPS